MKTSDRGAFALACHEGIVPGPYFDSVHVLTWGIGHTKAAGAPDPATLPPGMPADLDAAIAACLAAFRRDLAKYETAVAAAVHVPLTQAEFDALVSFHYNTGAIAKASLTARLNQGDKAGAASGFLNWVKPPEVIGRRKAEQALFAQGIYPAGPVDVWQVSAAGRVIFKTTRQLTLGQFTAALGDA